MATIDQTSQTASRAAGQAFLPSRWAIAVLLVMSLASAGILIGFAGGFTHTLHFRGPFQSDATAGSRLVSVQLPDDHRLSCCVLIRDDSGPDGPVSRLRLWINGVEAGPPHTLHETIRHGGPGFSHWHNQVYFALPDGVPNSSATEVLVRYPYWFRIRLAVIPLATLAMALALALAAFVTRNGPKLGRSMATTGSQVALASRVLQTALLGYLHRRRREAGIYLIISPAVFLILLAGSAALAQRDLEFLLQSDFNYGLILAFEKLIRTWSWGAVPVPGPNVYLDGQYFIYGAATALLRSLVSLPSDLSYALAAAFTVNAIAYATGCWFFWRTVLTVTGRNWLALLACAVLFMSPPMLAIDLIRVDYLIFGPLLATVYYSALFALGKERARHAVLLGLWLGLLSGLKLNGIMYGAIPVCALAARWRVGRPEMKFIGTALACFGVVLAVSFTRYFVYLPIAEIPKTLVAAAASLRDWAQFYPNSWHYYLTDLFIGHGRIFVAGCLAAWAIATVRAIVWRRPFDLFVALNLLWMGIYGVLTPLKYERGGYHLLPFYLLALVAVAEWRTMTNGTKSKRSPDHKRTAAWSRIRLACAFVVARTRYAVAAILLVSLALSTVDYRQLLSDRAKEAERVNAVKREPRKWLARHVAPGTTICIMRHSDWTIPPLEDLGFKPTYGPFEFPYLYPDQLAAYPIPDIKSLPQQCPIIAFADLHQSFYEARMEQASPAKAAQWKAFYAELKTTYPPVVFTTDKAVGGVARIELYDLRQGVQRRP